MALNVDHVFEADQCDAFDSDVDEAPTTQTMFMANLTSEEAGPSYDSNTPFEVQDHDTFVDHMDEYHEVHEMQNDVQHNYVVDSDADYTSDSNIIPYDQYVEDNEEHVVQSNVSSVRNDALMSILDEMHEQGVQSMSVNKQDKVVNDSVTSELARYKELVGVYEQRAKFELTDRERKIDEQMRIIISDRNQKETSLKSELHSAQLQLLPTGKPKVPAPVPTGRQNRPFLVLTDRGYSPSVTSGWWKSTARPMPHFNRPTSSYFQTYTPYVPQMYYNHMKYGGVRWATAVKPSTGCSWKTHRKGLYWENPYSDAKDAEELQKRASAKTAPPCSIPVSTGSIPVPSGNPMVSPNDVSVPTGGVPVPSSSPTDSFFDAEPTTQFSSPSDLGNNVLSPGIFSSTSYDDEFGDDLNNLASTMEV
ncbi:hypothetical protein Tco_0345222, partial [Tanacetum coccineum]